MRQRDLSFQIPGTIFGGILIFTALMFMDTKTNAQSPSSRVPPPSTEITVPANPATTPLSSQPDQPLISPFMFSPGHKPIVIEKPSESLSDRLKRTITLDVREMNLIDVLKFLALKGDFNMVTSNEVTGRVTLFLKNVTINDVLDIVLITNRMAYTIDRDIVHVMSEAEYQAMFGKKFNDKNIVEIIQLKYAKPSYVLATLDNLKSSLGRIIIDEDTGSVVMIDTTQSIELMKKALEEMEAPLETFVYSLQFAKADVVAEKLRPRIDAHTVGTITVDERTNKLIVRALPERRKELEKLIKDLDTPTKEVLVECRVLQVVFKPQLDYGIDWAHDFKDSSWPELRKITFKNIYLEESKLSTSSNLFSKFARVGVGKIDINKFATAIRALKQVSDTKILANPKILVTNNEEARIHVGDTVPYIISTTSGTGDNAITSEDVRFTDVGLKLNVTPTINEEGFVTMALRPEISTVVAKISSKGGGIPQVNKTEVQTTVMVKDGMTIVLGGLKKENKVQSRVGFPFLMDVPFLGKMFSSTSDVIESTEIIIFITPHVVTGVEDYRKFKGVIKPPKDYSSKETQNKAGLTIKN